ncbi:MAG: hypothetical protein KDE27_10565 [Planctomycetes bacterium]|nr:hypothetical protein [Planctomycetota bacterium]
MTTHSRTGTLAVAVLLTSFLPAQAPDAGSGTVRPAVAAAWQSFQNQTGGQWVARWHAPTGTPRMIYGSGIDLPDWRGNSLDEARRQADAALQRWPDLLGLGDSTFVERIGARMGQVWSFTFDQQYRGIPVLDGRADVRVHMRGRISALGSTAVPIPADFVTVPAIAEATATAIAWNSQGLEPNAVPQPGRRPDSRLVIWSDGAADALAAPALAWEIPIAAVQADGSGPVGRVYVDAQTGRPLQYRNDKHECGIPGCTGSASEPVASAVASAPVTPPPATYTVMGWLRTGYSPISAPTNEPLVGVEVTVPGIGTLVTDQNGQFTANLSTPTSVTVQLDGIHMQLIAGTQPQTATLTLQPGVNQTFQLCSQTATQDQMAHTTTYYWTHEINEFVRGIVGNLPELSIADMVQPTVNITSSCNAYYTNNSINFYFQTTQCNNTSAASVVAHEWGHGIDDRFGGISQTNGLSEGWGDICSIYLLDDPTIGHDFYTNGTPIRTGTNTRQYPGGSGPHAQGESWMGFAWKYRENLRTNYGTQQALAISNATVLGTLVADAKNQMDAVLEVFIADDNDANLNNGTPHHPELAAACTAHNLPYPPILAGDLVHLPLGQSNDPLVPRFVECDAIPTFGSFASVELFYNDGQPRQVAMIPTATPNRYRALVPGMFSPQVLTYHIVATHSSNAVFRSPVVGEHSYATYTSAVIWREDFENGGVGWTHGATIGNDDWEIAAPGGFGTTQWSDPTTAYSGARCAGTDLTGDGAYSPSSDCWLRSPSIDCSGQTNLRIRLKRFVSSPNTFGDRLELYCEGFLIWATPYAPLVETGWVSWETQLWMATNNPSVELEFRSISDGTEEFGGWNVDDIEIFTPTATIPPANALRVLPAQQQQGGPMMLTVQTPASQPFLWILGTDGGPTAIAGLPPLLVGGNTTALFAYTDATGSFALPFSAPSNAPLTGTVWYSQVLTLTPGGQFVTSNQHVNLFTQ